MPGTQQKLTHETFIVCVSNITATGKERQKEEGVISPHPTAFSGFNLKKVGVLGKAGYFS